MNKHLLLWILLVSCFLSGQTYCIPAFFYGCDLGDQIDSFTISSIGFSHQNTGCSSNAYGDFTSQTISLNAGVNYNFSITHGFSQQNVRIWIDFNNDGTFTDAAPELVASGSSAFVANVDVTNGTISIPSTIASGLYRMRVVDRFEYQPLPCNIDGFGEAHDYTVSIGGTPSCLAPDNLLVSNITSSSATLSWSASASQASLGYEYFLSTNSSVPVSSTVATGSVGAGVLNATLAVSPATNYYVWVRSVCSSASKSSWSAVLNFATPCLSITPSYTNNFNTFPGSCWSQASGGSPSTGSTGTDIYWVEDGFVNTNYTGAASVNLFDQNRKGWLKSPVFDLSAGGYLVKFNYGITAFDTGAASAMGSDDVVQFLVSTNGGTSWTVLQTWNAANAPSNTSNLFSLNLTGYNSLNTVFAFYASDGTVIDAQDYQFFVDNFTIESASNLASAENSLDKNEVQIYPNPFKDYVYLKNNKEIEKISVTDLNGRMIKNFNGNESSLPMNDLSSGVYLLILKLKDGSQKTHKIIKK